MLSDSPRNCSSCGAACDARLLAKSAEVSPSLARLIAAEQPGWGPRRPLCPRCLLRFVAQLQRERSAVSLQASTSPPSTFPYYHVSEETVLPQNIRLPSHEGFDGSGVTVAFLDSGYYPHPDLTLAHEWPTTPTGEYDVLPGEQLDAAQWAAVLRRQPLRLAHYVDLTDHKQVEGLDAPSLWDAAGDSWHGEMTTTVALGNGLLSGGRFRGYAPGASALPIKIGGGGRIPEADILRGLQWLLEGDRWERYGVRVLNVSVGGDLDEPWQRNKVSLAAEELSRRGVLVAAAVGNRGHDIVMPPAQSPAVLTVGGVDDFNRRWSPLELDEIARLELYHHNWSEIEVGLALEAEAAIELPFAVGDGRLQKPEVLALARWLPAPVLPPTAVFAEMVEIGKLRQRLLAGGELTASEIPPLFTRLPSHRKRRNPQPASVQRASLWRALRTRMNSHKWVHPHYQHVDGTSVAVAQVSALAAQMVQANPALMPSQIKQLIVQSSLPLPHQPAERSGAGLIQPTLAVAAAMRAEGGQLAGLPTSGTSPDFRPAAPHLGDGAARCYVGVWSPHARSVSVVGDFNDWQVGAWPLTCVRDGWWHGLLHLHPGRHLYRFWVEGEEPGSAAFLPDPENPARAESGYASDHSVIMVAA